MDFPRPTEFEDNLVTVYPLPEEEGILPPKQYRFIYISIYPTPEDKLNQHVAESPASKILSFLKRSWSLREEPIKAIYLDPVEKNSLKWIYVVMDECGKLRESFTEVGTESPTDDIVFNVERVEPMSPNEVRIRNGSYCWKIVHTSFNDPTLRAIQPTRPFEYDDTFSFKLVEYEGLASFNGDMKAVRLMLITSLDGACVQISSLRNLLLDLTDNTCLKDKYTDVSLMDSRFFAHVQSGDYPTLRLIQPIACQNQLLALDDDAIVLQSMDVPILSGLTPNEVKNLADNANQWFVDPI